MTVELTGAYWKQLLLLCGVNEEGLNVSRKYLYIKQPFLEHTETALITLILFLCSNMASSKSIVLTNGTVLIHDANNHVVPTQTSILIKDGKIAKIAKDIKGEEGVEVIDCTDKIISPGLIDTHHHGWQTQLKGRHANQLLMEYMVSGIPAFF
jgi:hypothetical protein